MRVWSKVRQIVLSTHPQPPLTPRSDVAVYCVTANVPVDILYKLDTDKGGTEVINVRFLTNPEKNEFKKLPKKAREGEFSAALRMMRTLNDRQKDSGNLRFVQACVLAGCDYLTSLPGVGLITSFKAAATKPIRVWVHEVCKKAEQNKSEKEKEVRLGARVRVSEGRGRGLIDLRRHVVSPLPSRCVKSHLLQLASLIAVAGGRAGPDRVLGGL